MSSNSLCSFNFVTPDECFNRWVYLQKRNGRTISTNFRPPQVFQSEYSPVHYFPSFFSINKRKSIRVQIPFKSSNDICFKVPQNSFDFYLKHNTRPETNHYFSNYQKLHTKFYNEPSVSINYKPSTAKPTKIIPTQQFIDKEEENSLTVFELLEIVKADPDSLNGNGAPSGKVAKGNSSTICVKKK